MEKKQNDDLGELKFVDQSDIEDLQTMLRRLEVVGEDEIVLEKNNNILSIYGCTQSSGGLLSNSNTILVHRAFKLTENNPNDTVARVVAPLRSVLDRIARLKENEITFNAPTSSLFASWAGLMPNKEAWHKLGEISSSSLAEVAKQGMERVATILPEDAGLPVLDKVRRSVWDLEVAPQVPAGAAFALETLGFLEGTNTVQVFKKASWVRLSSKQGDVLIKSV